MTIGSSSPPRSIYNCDGVSKVFPVPIQAYQNTDLTVILTAPLSAGGAQTLLVLNSDYILAPSGTLQPPAWTLTTLPAAAYLAGYELQVFINPVQEQQTQYVDGQAFPAAAVQANFDRLTQMVQRLQDESNRSVKATDGDANPHLALASAAVRAHLMMTFDGDGNLLLVPQPINGSITRDVIGQLLSPITTGEVGVTDTSYTYGDARRFGARLDRTTDDTVALQNALNCNSVVVVIGSAYIAGNLIIPANTTLQGPLRNVGEQLAGNFRYDNINGNLFLASTATITLRDAAAIKGFVILNSALKGALPFANATAAQNAVTAFSGTAITAGGADVMVEDCWIGGFAQAFSSSARERTKLIRVQIDCANGVLISNSTDIARIEDVHCWEFLTTHQGFTTTQLLTRSGSAFKTTSHFDGGMFINCFSYGWAVGFDIQSLEEVSLISCFADGPSAGTGQIGFKLTGSADLINVSGGGSSGMDQGVYINVAPASTAGSIKIHDMDLWGNRAHVVSDQHKDLALRGNTFRDTNGAPNTGVTLSGTVTGITTIEQNTFSAISNAFSIAASAVEKCRIGRNTYDLSNGPIGGLTNDRVLTNGGSEPTQIWSNYDSGIGGFLLKFRQSTGTVAAPTAALNNATPLSLQGEVFDGGAFRSIAQIRYTARGAPTPGVAAGAILFATNHTGASTVDTLIVNENGNFFPVTDNVYSCGANGQKWSSVWSATGTIQTSDSRTKADVADAALGLDFILGLRPVSYKFKVGGNEVVRQVYLDKEGNEIPDGDPIPQEAIPGRIITRQKPGTRTHWGLIAQEVKAAADKCGLDFAGWIKTDPANPESEEGLRYDQFIAPLIRSVQELSSKLADLEKRLS